MKAKKTLFKRVICLCAGLVMALSLAAAAARACSDVVIGMGWSCELTGEDSQYCYYNCECHGISEAQCGNRLGLAGFEMI